MKKKQQAILCDYNYSTDAVQNAFDRWGKPNGYILGQEAAGAFFGGLRYGGGIEAVYYNTLRL